MFLISLTTALVLALALLLVYFLTSYLTQDGLEEKMSPFECGFDPLSETRSPFSTRFFLLVVLFLIFDVEVALLFPIHTMTWMTVSTMMTLSLSAFLTILLFGMFHEWNEGALDWTKE